MNIMLSADCSLAVYRVVAHRRPQSGPQLFQVCLTVIVQLQEGQKHIFHLEAFVAKFMSEYKNWALSAFG